jgi:FdhD protein
MTEKTPDISDNTPRRMTFAHVSRTIERDGKTVAASRAVPEEVPVALSFGGTTHAVMMASPSDLEDFAIGFSLSERIITRQDDITSMDIIDVGEGLDIQCSLRMIYNLNFQPNAALWQVPWDVVYAE